MKNNQPTLTVISKGFPVRCVGATHKPKLLTSYFSTIISFLLVLLSGSMSFAQFAGWPTSSTNPEVDQVSMSFSTSATLDDNRAQVTGATLVSSSPDIYDLNLANINGSFGVDKWCLLIQMEDHIKSSSIDKTGNHCRVEVVSLTGSVLRVRVPSGNSFPSLDFATSNRVQIIQVPFYWSLTLNPGASLTCAPYDPATGTGGIAAVIADNITFNGGHITASGKGYSTVWSGSPSLGTGGIGTLAAPNTTPTSPLFPGGPYAYLLDQGVNPPTQDAPYGLVSPYGPPTVTNDHHGFICSPTGNIADFVSTAGLNNGGDGHYANNNVTPGGLTSGNSNIYPTGFYYSSPWNTLRMGNNGNPGSSGGAGAGGGGFGGNGGSNGSIHPPQFGQQGGDGGNGGNAGAGGNGGGIVLLKVNTINAIPSNLSSTAGFLFADGENGHPGTNGEDGGSGGIGGLGSDGDCDNGTNQIIPPGGRGGYGQDGIGAGGGDGGDAGHAGTIWVMKKSGPSIASHAYLRPGTAGSGGTGGYTDHYATLPLANNYSPTGDIAGLACNTQNYEFCPPTPPCPILEVCDCDEVFRHIAEDLTNLVVVSNSSYPYELNSTPTNPYPVYFTDNYHGQPTLYYTYDPPGACPWRYNCVMNNKNEFIDFMKKFYKVPQYDLMSFTPPSGSTYNVGANTGILQVPTPEVLLKYNDGSTLWDVFEYKMGYNQYGVLYDVDDPSKPYVYEGNCHKSWAVYSSGGGSGIDPWGGTPPGGGFGTLPDGDPSNEGEGQGGHGGPGNGPEVTIIKVKTLTGAGGTDGAGAGSNGNGNFEEDGDPPSPPPIKLGFNEFSEFVDVINDPMTHSITLKLKPDVQNVTKYTLIAMNGQVIQQGNFSTELVVNQSAGVYIAILEQNGIYDIRKIAITD